MIKFSYYKINFSFIKKHFILFFLFFHQKAFDN